MIRFESPLAFLLLVFLPLVLEPETRRRLLGMLRVKRSSSPPPGALLFASPVNLKALSGSWKAKNRSEFLSTLRALTFLLLVTALARPQAGQAFTEVEASGRDIMLALDLSGSMEAVDFFIEKKRVDRLVALKYVVKQFIDARPGDRIGLIVFGDQVFTQCPLTLDHGALKDFVDGLQIGMAGRGTAVGDAIALALKRIREIPGDTRTIVLVTDGKSHDGTFSPSQAAELAKNLHVKIHSVGIGGTGSAPFWEPGFFGGMQLVNHPVEYDEASLRMIAQTSGGEYFNAKDLSGLQQVYSQIDKLEERQERTEHYVQYQEQFLLLVVMALILTAIYEISLGSVFLKIP